MPDSQDWTESQERSIEAVAFRNKSPQEYIADWEPTWDAYRKIGKPHRLNNLPEFIPLEIMSRFLTSIECACMGVACKCFYVVYQNLFSAYPVPLRQPSIPRVTDGQYIVMETMLWQYLEKWMEKAGLYWDYDISKFNTKERIERKNRKVCWDG